MPPELRKRKAPAGEPATAPPAKKKGPVAKAVAKVKETIAPKTKKSAPKTNGATSTKIAVGETIDLEGFGGEIETNDGVKTTLKTLVDESKSGVVLFTYPQASTPGCTKQACAFRDDHTALTATGFSIYGLSKDSPKRNTTFKDKYTLPYTLLCDTSSTLISAIGLKRVPNSTARGVFVIDKSGKILAAEAGSGPVTVAVAKKIVGGGEVATEAPAAELATEEPVPEANGVNGTNGDTKEDADKAEVAAEVADTAEKLDSNEAKPVAA